MAVPTRYNFADWVESSGTSFSHAFDVGSGSNRVLVVGIRAQTATDTVVAPTFNGVTMSLAYKRQNTNAQSLEWMYYYWLAAPASGSNTLAFTTGVSCAPLWFAYAFTGAKQTGQPNATGSNTRGSGSGTFTVSLTTTTNDCYLIGQQDDNNGNMAASTGTTRRSTWAAGLGQQTFDNNGVSNTAGSNSLVVTGSNGGAQDFTVIAIEPAITAYTITAAQGSFTLSGQTVNFVRGKGFQAAFGSFTLAGQAVALRSAWKILAAQGSYTLSGQTVNFMKGKGLQAAVGLFTLTGFAITIGGSGSWKWTNRSKPSSSYSNRSKPSSVWTDRSKPNSIWTNRGKP